MKKHATELAEEALKELGPLPSLSPKDMPGGRNAGGIQAGGIQAP